MANVEDKELKRVVEVIPIVLIANNKDISKIHVTHFKHSQREPPLLCRLNLVKKKIKGLKF